MRFNVHVIMGLNDDSVGLAYKLKENYKVVYICDDTVEVLENREDFTYVHEDFIHAMDPLITKVIVYEPPYKTGKIVNKSRSFIMERKSPVEKD
ncbi:hypothetical protein [Paenisporosarcina antarctica]|uniref:Uncharacterized protein n=1 Tax=Paenisporosarcina antarctica TaxID=417367 RepID=A0A4P6ZZI9_9BACL|nr:hypothetical protein [Paenisporosarcina antarctica]QBP42001.1 hypothetical protein E2636_12955 [Paenisporosarcina antarctica]